MARGLQKEQSQKKNAEKQKAMQKSGSKKDEGVSKMKKSVICPICKVRREPLSALCHAHLHLLQPCHRLCSQSVMPKYSVLVDHYGAKHPKETVPTEESLAK